MQLRFEECMVDVSRDIPRAAAAVFAANGNPQQSKCPEREVNWRDITDAQRRARERGQRAEATQHEENEITRFAQLDDRQLLESAAWFEFAIRFNEEDKVRQVLMLCSWALKRRRSWSASARRHRSRVMDRGAAGHRGGVGGGVVQCVRADGGHESS